MRIVLCCLFVVLTCGACAPRDDDSDRVLRLALQTAPNRLDPALVVDVAEGQVCSMLFEGLVRFTPDGEVVGGAASSWAIDADGLTYRFRLNPNARFSNGRAVTPRDVVASFERVLAPDGRSSRRWVLDRIRGAQAFSAGDRPRLDGVYVADDSTVVIELEAPFRPFLQLLGMPAAAIVPADLGGLSDDEFASSPVGSGRWQLAEWRRGDYLSLLPNPYHSGASPAVSEIRWRIIPEAFTRVAEYESGSLDILEVPVAELSRFLEDRRERVQSRPELRVVYIGLNNSLAPFDDVRVRRALNMAVDVDRLIEVLTGAGAIRATGAIPPTLGGYHERDAYPYDPAAARRLLAEAGYADGFSMDIWQRDSPDGNRVVEAVQGYLMEVGVEVKIVKREWSAFKQAVSQGKVDAFFLDWYADYPDAENFLFPLFHSDNVGGGGNRAFFRNARIDSLIEAAQRAPGADVGYRLYATADSLVYDAAPWIFLYFPTRFVAVAPGVEHYRYPAVYLGEDFSVVRKTHRQ